MSFTIKDFEKAISAIENMKPPTEEELKQRDKAIKEYKKDLQRKRKEGITYTTEPTVIVKDMRV